jgi:hypothetical protein
MQTVLRICLVLSLLAAFSSCAKYDRRVSVADVKKEEIVVLRKEPNQGNVYGISIRGSGNIDGEARIAWMLDGKPYKTKPLKKKVKFSWGGDWYSDTAEIHYEPVRVSRGELIIEYQFSTLE